MDQKAVQVGLMLPPYEAWCSAPANHVGHCGGAVFWDISVKDPKGPSDP